MSCVFVKESEEIETPVWIKVTEMPMAKWLTHQITKAFPRDDATQQFIRDRNLRHHYYTSIARHGHPGQAYCTSLASWQDAACRVSLRGRFST
jgi:hypothetical protein